MFEWVDATPVESVYSWHDAVSQAARLADAPSTGLDSIAAEFAIGADDFAKVLGRLQAIEFGQRWLEAADAVAHLVNTGPLVLCHGDLNPSNVLVDMVGRSWLLDMEHSLLAPPEWDPAKVVILAQRFHDVPDHQALLAAWPQLDPVRLATCVAAQETLVIGWLVLMAQAGVPGASNEARRRAEGLNGGGSCWKHLSE